jgi:threonine synthase
VSFATHLECPKTGEQLPVDRPQNLSSVGAPLLVRYDLAAVKQAVSKADLADRPRDIWRFRELLPVEDYASVATLGEGWSPLLEAPRLAKAIGLERVLIKDEGFNPTGTFKARGAALGVTRANELGVTQIAMPTAGNAGSAWAAYCARAGLDIHIVMPADAPLANQQEVSIAGANLYLVDGLISDAGRIVGRAVAERGWFDASTLKEPYRIEGKKTMGFEIAEQLGWRMPDVIIYPTGGGVGLIGIHKALTELLELGWLTGPLPRLVAVQSSGCAPIVRAFEAGARESQLWEDAHTVAFGITVPKALGDFLVLDALYATGGRAVAVDDHDLLADLALVGRLEGMFLCPEGAATVTAARALRDQGWIESDDEVVLLNTGAGVLYPDLVRVEAHLVGKNGMFQLNRLNG